MTREPLVGAGGAREVSPGLVRAVIGCPSPPPRPGVAAAAMQLGALLAAEETRRSDLVGRLAMPLPALPDPGTLKGAVLASLAFYGPAVATAAITNARASLAADLAGATAVRGAATPVRSMLNGALAVDGVAPMRFDGDPTALGAELVPAVASTLGGAPFKAIVLLAPTPATWAALSSVFQT